MQSVAAALSCHTPRRILRPMRPSVFRPHRTWLLLAALGLGACQCGDEGLQSTKARLEVTPLELDFHEVPVGELRALGLELKNSGNSPLSLSFTLTSSSAELSRGSELPTSLAASQVLSVSILYQPTNLGLDRGQISLSTDTGQDPISVPVRGVGVQGAIAVDSGAESCGGQPGSASFGAVRPGQTAERTIKLRASGAVSVQVLSVSMETGSAPELDFVPLSLPATLAPGAELGLVARYRPTDGGADQGALIITTDAPSSPSIRVPLCGTGVAPALCARPVPLDLGAVPPGRTATGTLTLESCGLEPLELSALGLSSDAAHPSDPAFTLGAAPALPLSLAPGQTTTVEVRFLAGAPRGPQNAWIEATSNALGAAVSDFPVVAHTASPCGLSVEPPALEYFGVAAGTTAQKTVLVANAGEAACVLSGLALTSTSGSFHLPAPPITPDTIAPGDVRLIAVEYAPTGPGPDHGTLVVTEQGGTSYTVDLRGRETVGAECTVDLRPSALNFGVVGLGATAHLGVVVRNLSEEACRIRSARIVGGSSVYQTGVPGLGLLPLNGSNATIDVAFTPAGPGTVVDVLEVVVGGTAGAPGGGTYRIGLSGASGDARLCVNPVDLRFGTVTQGSSAERDVAITSCGSAPVRLRGTMLTSGRALGFSIVRAPTVPTSLVPTASAAPSLRVRYAPTSAGPHFGQIDVLSDDPLSPDTKILLSGNWDEGCTRVLDCAPLSLDFGPSEVGRSKLIRVVCRNAGPSPVNISAVGLSGGSAALSVQATVPTALASGASYNFDVFYTPLGTSSENATLSISSDACLGPPALPVRGSGVVVPLPMCQPPSTFQPMLRWEWAGSTVEPTMNNVWMTPLVANLTDDNGDGRIDENDVPEVVFVSYDHNSLLDPNAARPGVLRVVSGDTGAERFSVTSPRFPDSGQLAIGDLDGDGSPEIVGMKYVMTPQGSGANGFFGRYTTGTLVALDRTGQLLWESDPFSWPSEVTWSAAGPAIADLDGDGTAEIILGREVFDHLGRRLWTGAGDAGIVPGGPQSIAADIDGDGHPEVIAGGTVYNRDGTIRWSLSDALEGGTAVGRLDPADPFPEIALFTDQLRVLDHLGMERWHAPIPTSGPRTQLPTLADFDGDGDLDIAVADGVGVHVFHGTGGLMWSGVVTDNTCCPGISAFDFEGDGAWELLLNDFGNIYVYRGDNGGLIYTAARPSQTNLELPVVADVDNDGHAEIVVAIQTAGGSGGVKAYSNMGNHWVSAPRIWNQQAYSVDNVTESGQIPRLLPPMRPTGPFRGTVARCQ